jgi:hypothetical protein
LRENLRRRGLGDLADYAFGAYAAHAGVYLGAATLAVALLGAITFLTRSDDLVFTLSSLVTDALVTTFVTIGVSMTMREEAWTLSRLVERFRERWVAILAVDLLVAPLQALAPETVFSTEPAAWLLIPFTLIVLGTFSISCAVAATEEPRPGLILYALTRSVALAARTTNLLRTLVLGALQIPLAMGSFVIADQLTAHKIAGAQYWSFAPFEIAGATLFDAFFVAFYFDLLAREPGS